MSLSTSPSPSSPELTAARANGHASPQPEPPEAEAEAPLDPSDAEAQAAADASPVPILPDPPKGSLAWRIGGVIRTMRPHQWLKNAFVLAPVFFAKDIFHPPLLLTATAAFAVFCLLAGAVYTMNDLVDVESDRVHPVKRERPIPSGRVPIGTAKALAVALVVVSLGGGMFLSPAFAAVAAAYFVLNVAYSFRLKNIAYLDVGCIAAGFVLRVLAGGLATGIHVSGYLFLCTALLALFLGLGKRRHELAQAEHNAGKQRKALKAYSKGTLDMALGLMALATVGTYAAYTLDTQTRAFFHSDHLWPSTGFTIFGMFRFLQLVRSRPHAESPTQEILRDVPFILNLVFWVVWVVFIVYQLRPTVTG